MLLTDIAQLKSSGAGEQVAVVIGSGAIGLYAASELAKRGRRVLVVESGGVHLGGFSPGLTIRSASRTTASGSREAAAWGAQRIFGAGNWSSFSRSTSRGATGCPAARGR